MTNSHGDDTSIARITTSVFANRHRELDRGSSVGRSAKGTLAEQRLDAPAERLAGTAPNCTLANYTTKLAHSASGGSTSDSRNSSNSGTNNSGRVAA